MLPTPVVLILFRRPDLTRQVLQAIRRAQPQTLLVIADGPSPTRPGEADQCAAARAVVDELVDWPCRLVKNYSEENLGVTRRFDTGFRWVFEQVEEAIFLEDDELPSDAFFPFAAEMLNRYRDDNRVSVINGANFLLNGYTPPHSYYFSRYFHCWGFATWRRFWNTYDANITRWPARRATAWLTDLCDHNAAEANYHAKNFDRVINAQVQTWDYQVTFAMWDQNSLAITPSKNLVSNIGFAAGGLHHQSPGDNPFAALPTQDLPFPLTHPAVIQRDKQADATEYERVIGDWLRAHRPRPSVLRRLLARLRQR